MSWWLGHYVLKTTPTAYGVNYIISALANGAMHGIAWGNFATYLTATVNVWHDRLLHRHVTMYGDSWGAFAQRAFWAFINLIWATYSFLPYCIRPWPIGLMLWAEMGFIWHILLLASGAVLTVVDTLYPAHRAPNKYRPHRGAWQYAQAVWSVLAGCVGHAKVD